MNKALRILELSEQLQSITNELKTLSNTQERPQRITRKQQDINFLKRIHK